MLESGESFATIRKRKTQQNGFCILYHMFTKLIVAMDELRKLVARYFSNK